ncbi:MAG: hypothetical protein KatS3mg016_2362 [Fimbriimonadales bacterium]|nr:MAG: hypothetical protein KatS3mg016_2362 [Fimbriimonadales bacterium]
MQDTSIEALLRGMVEMTFVDEVLVSHAPQHLVYLVNQYGGPAPMPPILAEVIQSYERLFKRRMVCIAVKSDTFNAGCLADGSMIFHTGTLHWTGNDRDAVAGIIGHEIAHYERKHLAQNARRAWIANSAVRIAFQSLSGSDLIQTLIQLGLWRYNREQELESDRLGFVYSVRAGYDPEGSIRAFKAMENFSKSMGGAPPEYLSTHPSTPRRIQKLEEYYAAYRAGVPLHWIEVDFVTKAGDLDKVIGAEPRVVVASTVFMDVKMNLPGDAYRRNQFPRFAITARVEGYATIISFAPDKTVRLLLPNPYKSSNKLRENETVVVPDMTHIDTQGRNVRLRWDQKGTYHFLFLMTNQYLSLPFAPYKASSLDQLKDEIRQKAKEQRVLILDMQEQRISVR